MNNIEKFSKNCTGEYNLKDFANMFSPLSFQVVRGKHASPQSSNYRTSKSLTD